MFNRRCPSCTSDYCPIPPDGPINARVYCYGERPGYSEELAMREAIASGIMPKHLCFIGAAGDEFNNTYLELGGLRRDDVRVGNLVLCGAPLNRKPTANEAMACASHHVPNELAAGNPEVVVLMGATACKLVPGIDLEAEHGIPRLAQIYDWCGWVVPMYHPAAGLHDTAMMIPLLEDWEVLERWLRLGEWQWAVDATNKDYGLIDTRVEVQEFLHYWSVNVPEPYLIGGDTESHDRKDYSWQLSPMDNYARMVMLKNREVCKEIADWINAQIGFGDATFVFHHAPADLPIFERQLEFGLDGLYRDTMQEAYGFGGLYGRLGLKVLSRRLLGRQRLSWEETVTPYSKDMLLMWMMGAFAYAESFMRTTVETRETNRVSPKTGKALKDLIKRKVVKDPAESALWSIYQHAMDNPDYPSDMTLWQKVEERVGGDFIGMMRHKAEVGVMPVRGIAHCPIDVQIDYACSDPDDTRQLAVMFDQKRREYLEGLNVQPEDCD